MVSDNQIKIVISGDGSNANVAIRDVEKGLEKLGPAASDASRKFDSLNKTLLGMGATIAGLVSVGSIARDFMDAAIAGQRFEASFKVITGSAQQAGVELAYVQSVAQKMGMELDATAESWLSLSAAAKGTTLEGQASRDIFEAVANTMGRLGKTSEDTKGALLALEQMISKGSVSSEELKGQLGERLPGAFQAAANAMGVTTAELGKMLDAGDVVASDMLPKLAKELNRLYDDGSRIGGLVPEWTRLRNEIELTWQAIDKEWNITGNLGEWIRGVADEWRQARIAFTGQSGLELNIGPVGDTIQRLNREIQTTREKIEAANTAFGNMSQVSQGNHWIEHAEQIKGYNNRITELRAEIEAQTKAAVEARKATDQHAASIGKIADDATKLTGKFKDLKPDFAINLKTAIQNAAKDGVTIGIESGFRTTERQAQLWAEALQKYGSAAAARKWVAPPGSSNHEKGAAVDITRTAEAYKWLAENAERFNLIRPMSWEPWHVEMIDGEKRLKEATQARTKAEDDARRMIEAARTPMEQYRASMEQLNAMKAKGLVTDQQYSQIAAGYLETKFREEQQIVKNSAAYQQEEAAKKASLEAQRQLEQLRLQMVPGAQQEQGTAQGLILLDSLIAKLQQAQALMANTQGIQQWQALLAQLQGQAAPGAVAGGMLQQQGMTPTTDMTQDSLVLQWAERYRLIQELRDRDLLMDDEARQRRLEADGMMHQQLIASEISSAQQRLQFGAGTFQDGVIASLSQVTAGYTSFQAGSAQLFGQFFNDITTGFANSFGRAIVYSEDLGEAMDKIGKEALASLISGLVKLGMQWVVMQIMSKVLGETAKKENAGLATEFAAQWAPAATLAAVGSYGTAGVAGSAALLATFGVATGIAAASSAGGAAGFATGGYTGDAPTDAVAGLVHGREYVINARATAANRPLLERINQGRPVGISPAPVSVQIQNFGTSKTFELEQVSETDIRIIARDEALSAISTSLADPNSRPSKALARHTTAGRRR